MDEKEELLYAFPLNVAINCWTLNQTQWEVVGMGGPPTTFTEVFEGYEKFEELYGKDAGYYQYINLYAQGAKGMVEYLVREYIKGFENKDFFPSFTDEAFLDPLKAMLASPALIQEAGDKVGIIMDSVPGSWVTYTDGTKLIAMAAPTFTDMIPKAEVHMTLGVINPASPNRDLAE